jgi:protein SCO1/2
MSRGSRGASLLAASLFAGSVLVPAMAHHGRTQGVNRESAGWPVASFALVDLSGQPFTERRFAGCWTFVVFGDVDCGLPCEAPLAALAQMRRRIAGSDAIRTTQVVFVSLDPERDTPERMRRHLAAFDIHFLGATGPRPALRRLMDDLDVAGRGALLLVGPDAVLRSELLPPYDPLLLTAEYLRTRSRR